MGSPNRQTTLNRTVLSCILNDISTYRSKKLAHVFRVRVNYQFEDLLLSDLSQDLSVGLGVGLADVHLRAGCRRCFYQIL